MLVHGGCATNLNGIAQYVYTDRTTPNPQFSVVTSVARSDSVTRAVHTNLIEETWTHAKKKLKKHLEYIYDKKYGRYLINQTTTN